MDKKAVKMDKSMRFCKGRGSGGIHAFLGLAKPLALGIESESGDKSEMRSNVSEISCF
jgi:hypothetical protein